MTTPAPAPVPLNWTVDASTFCTSCEIHLASTRRPICPVCLDEKRREES
jgi:hypothetical protein